MTLNIGDKAPDFDLPTQSGDNIKLADFAGQKLVIYFYPKDNTPGCTLEAKDFRDLLADFDAANTKIIGVSKDSIKKHQNFCDKYELPFDLISDEKGDMCERYGVWAEKSMFGKKYMGINRTTFLVDGSGVIQKIWPKVKVTGHAAEVLEAAKSI